MNVKPDLKSRTSGLVLHPTSLPGRFGIGDIGPEARRFVDFLASSSQGLWQILPLGPTHEDWFSPYSSFSAFAGNPLLISPEVLHEKGLLSADDLAAAPELPADYIDFRRVREVKWSLLRRACQRFRDRRNGQERDEFDAFCREAEPWLVDFALFMAIREASGGASWSRWEEGLRRRSPDALRAARRNLADEVFLQKYAQFEFFRQWALLKRYANARDVAILGDIPIYVAFDSADIWVHPEYFMLSPDALEPLFVAGVPPDDFFSSEGQRWGTPVYDWERLKQDDYAFWIDRFRMSFFQFDCVRLDHFRGFEAFWIIPREAPTPKVGRWVQGPGSDFFAAMRRRLGELPLVVEDLGYITPPVHALREEIGFPGMFVMQFAFGDSKNSPYLPYKCLPNAVIYTGTHDTDTTMGWFRSISEAERRALLDYLGALGPYGIPWDVMRLAWGSVARWALAPLQDVLGMGSEVRMNTPGTDSLKNWSFRFRKEALTDEACERLASITRIYGRC
jgi:4-alpha-glucanotransferase